MTYNTRFKDKLQREQKHRHRNFISIFYTSTSVRLVKNIHNRKQTSMFSMFRHRSPITTLGVIKKYRACAVNSMRAHLSLSISRQFRSRVSHK